MIWGVGTQYLAVISLVLHLQGRTFRGGWGYADTWVYSDNVCFKS